MNAWQGAKFGMYRTVENVLDAGAEVFAAEGAVRATVDKFKTIIEEILQATQKKIAVSSGIAADKNNLRLALCRTASRFAGVVYSYGATNGDYVLMDEMNVSYTKLTRIRDGEIALFCRFILSRGVALLAELADYGITQAKIDALQTAIDAYDATVSRPRLAVAQRSTQVAKLVALFKNGDRILKDRLDNLIPSYEDEHPDFVARYKNARIIIDPPTTKTQLKGFVLNKTGGAPIENASVTIVELEKTTQTKPTGRYLFKPIPNGKYTVKVSAEGFNDFQAENVEVKQGAINRLNAELLSE